MQISVEFECVWLSTGKKTDFLIIVLFYFIFGFFCRFHFVFVSEFYYRCRTLTHTRPDGSTHRTLIFKRIHFYIYLWKKYSALSQNVTLKLFFSPTSENCDSLAVWVLSECCAALLYRDLEDNSVSLWHAYATQICERERDRDRRPHEFYIMLIIDTKRYAFFSVFGKCEEKCRKMPLISSVVL